jgi:hypothetical protein
LNGNANGVKKKQSSPIIAVPAGALLLLQLWSHRHSRRPRIAKLEKTARKSRNPS